VTVETIVGGVELDATGIRIGGRPRLLLCASLFYFRLPREEWRDRLAQVRASGYTCVDVYFPWNFHETAPGEWSFDGRRDIAAFLFGREQLIEPRHIASIADDDHLQVQPGSRLSRDGKQRRRDEQNLRARVFQDVAILFRGQQRVERHRNDAGADRPPEQHREIDGIEHHHGDAVFARKPEPRQHRRDARDAVCEFAVGQASCGIDERGLGPAPLRDIAVDHVDGGVVAPHCAFLSLALCLSARHYIARIADQPDANLAGEFSCATRLPR